MTATDFLKLILGSVLAAATCPAGYAGQTDGNLKPTAVVSPSPAEASTGTANAVSPVVPAASPDQPLLAPSGFPVPALGQDYGLSIKVGDESEPLGLPSVGQLLPVGGKLPAIRLEASFTQPISLRDALRYALDNTLPIRISQTSESSQKWLWVGSLGNFLPNILMSYRQQILQGESLIGGVIPVSIHTPNIDTFVTFQQYVFQGGRVLYGMLNALNQYKASKYALGTTVNDTMLRIAKDYYSLVQNQALLQIEVSAVETSRAQLSLNEKLEKGGVGTHFNVLQSETQLASDEQNLLTQEVNFRLASLQLASDLNLDVAVNLLPYERQVKKVRVIDPSVDINDLIRIAIANRPELKQYNYLRLAAERNMQVQAAPLYPSLYFFGTITGNGQTLSRQHEVEPGSFSVVPLQAPAAGPVLNLSSTTSSTNGVVVAAGEKFTPAQVVSRQIRQSTAFGFEADWNYYGLGVANLGNIESARALARQAMLNSNQTLINVLQQVRQAYLGSEIAERQIDVASKAVVSSGEQLRLAAVRLANGVGTNIDVIQAQQVWTQARTNKVNAIIQFNIAQAQLLHDIGLATFDNLTSGRLVRQ